MEILRASNSEAVKGDPDYQQLMTLYNKPKSDELKADPKYKAFMAWCDANGILYPGVDFPAAFGTKGELLGMAASRDLKPNTAFLYVPTNLHINKHTIKQRSPELWNVFEQYPAVFFKHYDYQYLRIVTYVMMEMRKGPESFWFPYFEVISWSDLPMLWQSTEIEEFQDPVLIATIKAYRKDFDDEWRLVYEAIKNHEDLFPAISMEEKSYYELFIRAFCSVVTRCFGWGLPTTTMVPFADFINHHNVDSSYEFICRDVDPQIDPSTSEMHEDYFTATKREVDYSTLYSPEQQQEQITKDNEDLLLDKNRSLNYV